MATTNYDPFSGRIELPETKTCAFCVHVSVCGINDALVDATIKMDEYAELTIGYDKLLADLVAENCRQYSTGA